ncbi:MAG: ATP-binding protein [Roseiflexaceae bacterium]
MIDGELTFGDWLRRQRRALDLTRAELAARVSCSVSALRKFEVDELRPSRPLAEVLAGALHIAPEDRAAFVRFARDRPGADTTCLPVATVSPQHSVLRSTMRCTLPAQPTALIGREQELAAIHAILHRADLRLLTLTGPGRIGKTRLALQAAADMLNDFAHGAYFVNLAPISDPALVVATIAQTLGVTERGSRPLLETLKDELREQQVLLLLDNFEQVLAAAPQLAELLAACPKLKLLIISREVLHLYGEHEFGVPPLALPPTTDNRQPTTDDPDSLARAETIGQYAAVRLFIERAQAARSDFAVTNASAPAVAEICYRLDGLPLAIELAAAHVKLFSPRALLARLDHRLALLTGGGRDRPARHQTIRGAIDWSYNLLDPAEQTLFARLGVFVGGCTLEAATAVCNATNDLPMDVTEGVASLVDKSLLRLKASADGEPRFLMLETIREYALERLEAGGELGMLRQRHAAFFVTLAEAADPALSGLQQRAWLDRLETGHPNLRAAVAWSLTNVGSDMGLRLAVALGQFWARRGYLSEGRSWVTDALTPAGGTSRPDTAASRALQAKALTHETARLLGCANRPGSTPLYRAH